MNYKNKKILIIGGTSGLGKSITKEFISKKFEVYVIARNKSKNSLFKKVKFYECDVSKNDDLNNLIKVFKKRKLNFSHVIHNVGGSQKIYDYDASSIDYEKVWRSNFGYVVDLNNFVFKNMIKKKWGRIIHVSSSAAYNYHAPTPYSSAKNALNTYVKSIARKVIKHKIVVSAICPGPIKLQGRYMTKSQKKNNKFWREYSDRHLPINRMANPKEIIGVISFLCSDLASYCSGAIWNIDGSEY